MGQVQYISDENNNITAVIVPIDLWHELLPLTLNGFVLSDYLDSVF